MSETIFADANPEKRLFISLLTRDIPMIAAFLDLIDNSVNAALVPFADRLGTADGYVEVLEDTNVQPDTDIQLKISEQRVEIIDNAPGISLDIAKKHVFKFGRSEQNENETDRLSVYGLGLKRAFFKLGERVKITSDHVDGGFELNLDVVQWAKDTKLPWQFELVPRDPKEREQCGTTIEVWHLYDETKKRLKDGVFENQLRESIGETYAYFLSKFVRIIVNGERVVATKLQVGSNNATARFKSNSVTCTIIAGLGTPSSGKYRDSGSGWFVFCNGRAVICADKSSKTGWSNGLPIFQPKHRPFLGTVYFVSKHSDKLPWDTTKSRINEDSEVWQEAKLSMVSVGRTVTTFLDGRYSDGGTDIAQSELTQVAKDRVDAMKASVATASNFSVPDIHTKTTMRIQYDAEIKNVNAIKEYLGIPGMSGSNVGKHTFDFFLQNEVGEE